MVHPNGAEGRSAGPPAGPSTIDLHTHTLRSDGTVEPAALAAAAAAVGVRELSITDHDTLAGYLDGRAAAATAGIELIPGVEINTVADDADGFHEAELHILGYGMDTDSGELAAALAGQRGRRRERFDRMVRRLR